MKIHHEPDMDDIEDVDEILREMHDHDGIVEDFAFRLALALKHHCRNCQQVKDWHDKYIKQGELMAETARQNKRMRHWIGIDRCGDCNKCDDEIDIKCTFAGEPGGCNNRDCQAYVKEFGNSTHSHPSHKSHPSHPKLYATLHDLCEECSNGEGRIDMGWDCANCPIRKALAEASEETGGEA